MPVGATFGVPGRSGPSRRCGCGRGEHVGVELGAGVGRRREQPRKLILFSSSQRSVVVANVSGVSPSRPTITSAITWMPSAQHRDVLGVAARAVEALADRRGLSSFRLSKPIDSTRLGSSDGSSSSGSRAMLMVALDPCAPRWRRPSGMRDRVVVEEQRLAPNGGMRSIRRRTPRPDACGSCACRTSDRAVLSRGCGSPENMIGQKK